MKRTVMLLTLLLVLSGRASAFEDSTAALRFTRGISAVAGEVSFNVGKFLPRWFLRAHEVASEDNRQNDGLFGGYFARERGGLPLRAVMPAWFAKARPSETPPEEQGGFMASIGNLWFSEKTKPLVVPPPPPQKDQRLLGAIPRWYGEVKPQRGAVDLYLPLWFKSKGDIKAATLPQPEKTESKIPWVSNFLDQPLKPLVKEQPRQTQEKTRKTDPPRNYSQFKAAMETFVRRLDGKITLTVSPKLDDSAIDRYLQEIMFDWIIKSYSYEYEGGNFNVSLVYYDWYRVFRGAQNPQVGSRLSARDQKTCNAAWNVISSVLKSGGNRDQLTLIKGFHDYLVRSARYSDRPRYRTKNAILDDNHQTPDREAHSVLVDKEGICESYASAFQLMCRLAGVECILVCGKAGEPGDSDWHAWNMVRLGGRWRHVDVTFDDPTPDEPGKVYRNYFMLTDSQISKDHSWDRSRYPKTN